MGLNIKNPALEAEIRALAAETGEGLTEAIAVAVRDRRARLAKEVPPTVRLARRQAIEGIQERLRDFPKEYRTALMDDLYDEFGLPK